MLQNFLLRKLIESKMKDVPAEQREMIIAMVEKNPALFEQIAGEIKHKVDSGMDQMVATMEVMKLHEEELRSIAEK
jgi:hypothetical protein